MIRGSSVMVLAVCVFFVCACGGAGTTKPELDLQVELTETDGDSTSFDVSDTDGDVDVPESDVEADDDSVSIDGAETDDEAVDAAEVSDLSPRVEEGEWAIGGTSLHYRIVGEGQPLILLHGGPGGNCQGFARLEALADSYRVIMYDQRGSGLSERLGLSVTNRDTTLMSVERHVEDLEEIRQMLGLEKLVLLGHSWGGTLAAFYAATYPEHVQRAIIYNGGPMWPSIREQRAEEQARRQSAEVLAEIEALNQQLNDNIMSWTQDELDVWFLSMARLYFPTMLCDPSAFSEQESGPGGFWANYMTNAYIDTFEPTEFAQRFALVDAPLLLTWGRCEPAPIERQLLLRDAAPNASLVIFEHSGHQAMDEEPELFLETVRAFLADEPLPIEPYTGD
ncbi:MAG: alpha/beta fold hydrolase [Myxococcota bacterium]|nr:alpha/beta fold hydrolase [Myxococcota bacterium]